MKLQCCGYEVDTASEITTSQPIKPKPGDFTICLRCGAWHRFKDDLSIRPFEAEDTLDLDAHQRAHMRRITKLIQEHPWDSK
jgi:hypothetical protein